MKKYTLLTLLMVLCLTSISCKKELKKEKTKTTTELGYTLDSSTAKINWTAYKTTDKIAVKGEFTKITIKESKLSEDPLEVLNGSEFSIPISSIFSNNADRDSKLQEFFFGVMKNTELLQGKIAINNDQTGTLTITMNAITNSFPISYQLTDNIFSLSGTMDLDKWNGQEAIESINKACFDLHKAADGISKTWNDVQIDATISLIKKK